VGRSLHRFVSDGLVCGLGVSRVPTGVDSGVPGAKKQVFVPPGFERDLRSRIDAKRGESPLGSWRDCPAWRLFGFRCPQTDFLPDANLHVVASECLFCFPELPPLLTRESARHRLSKARRNRDSWGVCANV
jgi:hypothetical protein